VLAAEECMWKCLRCAEDIEDNLEVCWNCQADRVGNPSGGDLSSNETEDEPELKRFLNEKFSPKNCLQCHGVLKFVGSKEFQEGINFGILGDFGELFVSHTNLEMYVCPTCLRVEFFVSDPIS
jgi:hypothetical protein